jgi:hypothetical protein
LLSISGTAWVDSIPLWFNLRSPRITVEQSFWGRFWNAANSPVGVTIIGAIFMGVGAGTFKLLRDLWYWWKQRRRAPSSLAIDDSLTAFATLRCRSTPAAHFRWRVARTPPTTDNRDVGGRGRSHQSLLRIGTVPAICRDIGRPI